MRKRGVIFGILFVILLFLIIHFASAIPYVLFVDPTPTDGLRSTSSGNFEVNNTINDVGSLNELIWNWDNTNYTIYDEDLVLMYNFENNSMLGENDSVIVDISRRGNNGSVYNNSVSVVNGKYGKGESFAADNQSINVSDSASLHSTNMTISLWFNGSVPKVKQISAHSWSSYILLETGDLYSLGYNAQGQLGDNTTINRDIPVKVAGGFNFSLIADSGYSGNNDGLIGFMCGMLANGTSMCWGDNTYGQLGDNTTTNRYRPTAVAGNYNFSSIYIGRYDSCGLMQNGTLLCWGRNVYGELGDNTTTPSYKPKAQIGDYVFSQVTMGDTMVCGVLLNGSALCWGRNDYGALGNNATTHKYIPTPVFGDYNFSKIYAGNERVCGILQNSTVLRWGYLASYEKEFYNDNEFLSIPMRLAGNAYNFSDIEAFYSGFCGILTNGSLACWGHNTDGQLGIGTSEEQAMPSLVYGNYNFSQVSGGDRHIFGLTSEGVLLSWGKNNYNELGKGTKLTSTFLPVVFKYANISEYKVISLATYSVCSLFQNGSAMCWGWNSYGQIGENTTEDKDSPVFVYGDYNFSYIYSGRISTCGLLTNGSAMCWGWNSYGQLGNGTIGGQISIPLNVIGNYSFKKISVAPSSTCGILHNGSAMCWGRNVYGNLGIGNTTDMPTPQYVVGTYNFSLIEPGASHICGLLQNGSALCWGFNNNGKLGNGNSTNMNTPQYVRGSNVFSSISLGTGHTCGLLQNGSVLCWGLNTDGQLGLGGGNTTSMYTLQAVLGEYNFSSITTGLYYTCGLLQNGSALCWGDNDYGQLGDGTTASSTVPKVVNSGGNIFSSIYGEGYWNLGVLSDGRIITWGDNTYGQQATTPPFNKKIPTSGIYKGNIFGKNPNSFEIISTFDNNARIFFRGLVSDISIEKQYTQITLVINENQAYTYKNGELIDSLTPEVLSIYDDLSNLIIGNNTFGVVDELRVYNRSLSSSEVEQLYRTNLKNINSTSWEFYANESLSSGDKTYNYGLFGLSGGESFSLLRSIVKYTASSNNNDGYVITRPVITTPVTEKQLEAGYERNFKENNQIRFEFENKETIARINKINSNNVIVNVSGIDYTVNANETEKIDLDKDGYYDLQVSVGSINYNSGTSKLEFKEIHEAIPAEEEEEVIEEVGEDVVNEAVPEIEKKNTGIYFILIGGIVAIVLIALLTHKKVKKNKRYKQFGY